jgi:hypothetical protein
VVPQAFLKMKVKASFGCHDGAMKKNEGSVPDPQILTVGDRDI